MTPLDTDGFSLDRDDGDIPITAPPPMIELPSFFRGCTSATEAAARMLNEMSKPMSTQIHGLDARLDRIEMAQRLIIACLGEFEP